MICDGKELGSALLNEPVPAMPCYLGGDPEVKEYLHGRVRSATVTPREVFSLPAAQTETVSAESSLMKKMSSRSTVAMESLLPELIPGTM